MPKQTIALEESGPKRLEVSWRGLWKNVTIQLDGETIGTIPGQKQLSAGQEFELPDGSTLKVQLVKGLTATELQVLRNGQPLPGSASDPETRIQTACLMVFFIAGLNIVLGSVAGIFQVGFLQSMGIGLGSVIVGVVFLVLGYFVQRRSVAALAIAIAVFALDSILGFVLPAGRQYMLGAVVARIFLLVPMIRGVGAIQTLRK